MREEPLGILQERAFALYAPQLLEEGEGDDLRVREALYVLVASSAMRVEQHVGVAYEAEEHGQSLFQVGERAGMLGLGHPRFVSPRVRMTPCTVNPCNRYLGRPGAGSAPPRKPSPQRRPLLQKRGHGVSERRIEDGFVWGTVDIQAAVISVAIGRPLLLQNALLL